MKDDIKIGKKVRELRIERNLKQEDIQQFQAMKTIKKGYSEVSRIFLTSH